MAFLYNSQGVVDGYICRHGIDSRECTEVYFPNVPDLCARVGERMLAWYDTLPAQSHVRIGKVTQMRAGLTPDTSEEIPNTPNMKRLAGL